MKGITVKIRRLFLGALLVAMPVGAADPAYLRAYVDGLLASRFAGHGLVATAATAEGSVTLGARTCIGPAQRRAITRLLVQSGAVSDVVWGAGTVCEALPELAEALEQIEVNLLPEEELFPPLLADPRQARFSMSYQRYAAPGETFNAASVAFGEYFAFASGFARGVGASQVGIQGAVFALFNLDAPSSDLVNADYWIGLPLSYRRGPWSARLRLYHQSSHLGDEFLLGNPGFNRVNLSYESVDLTVSYEWERLRLYGGGGYIFHSEPELAPGQLHLGAEYVRANVLGALDFVAALDTKAASELDWRLSHALQAGFELRHAGARRVRLMLEHYRGHSPNGQFYQDRLHYTGLGLYFGF